MSRTQQALRQAVRAALTSPPLQYTINDNAPATLPAGNVLPKQVWLTGGAQAPMPMVSFAVGAMGSISRQIPERKLSLKIFCISSVGPDEATEIYEAVRARLHTADQNSQGPANISRAATSTTLPIAVRECVETRVSDVDFEDKTQRWYVTAEYSVVAV